MLQLSFGSGSSDEAPENPVTGAGGRARSQKLQLHAVFALRLRAARLLADSSLHALPEARAARSEQRQETVPRQGTAGGRAAAAACAYASEQDKRREEEAGGGGRLCPWPCVGAR